MLRQSEILASVDKGVANNLTDKQMSILVAMGKYSMTQQQAADFVGVAESTVKSYCKVIKKSLNKRTMAGAVFEAVRLGIIAPD